MLKKLVSRDRVRYTEDGFDLDLTYITDQIIAMSFPSTGLTSVWRNSELDVQKMLTARHGEQYMIWNLSSSKYDYELFENRIVDTPFPDHYAPPVTRLFSIVRSLDVWLQQDPANVAVVHCKGGKGRTGMIIVCCMLYMNTVPTIDEAMRCFATKRSTIANGVRQPSQVRYLNYFSEMLRSSKPLVRHMLRIKEIVFIGLPSKLDPITEVSLYDKNFLPYIVYTTANDRQTFVSFEQGLDDTKDLKIVPVELYVWDDFLVKAHTKDRKELFHFLLHTYFIYSGSQTVTLKASDLDSLSKALPPHFEVQFRFEVVRDEAKCRENFCAAGKSDNPMEIDCSYLIQDMRSVYAGRVGRKTGFLSASYRMMPRAESAPDLQAHEVKAERPVAISPMTPLRRAPPPPAPTPVYTYKKPE